MFKSFVLIGACVGALAFTPVAFAQTQKAPCGADKSHCVQKKSLSDVQDKAQNKAPKIGQSAKAGKPYQRSANSRFQAPPTGQEYRVVNDHIVLSDAKTKKIVKVLGSRASLEK